MWIRETKYEFKVKFNYCSYCSCFSDSDIFRYFTLNFNWNWTKKNMLGSKNNNHFTSLKHSSHNSQYSHIYMYTHSNKTTTTKEHTSLFHFYLSSSLCFVYRCCRYLILSLPAQSYSYFLVEVFWVGLKREQEKVQFTLCVF